MVISDVVKYKQKIMSKLISIQDVFTLVNNKDITLPSQMPNVNIFPYMKIPNTATSVKNYICYDYNSRILSNNSSFKNVIINIAVISHESDISCPWGNRHDVLAGVLIDAFNWSDFLGFTLELIADNESILEKEYHVRTLQFRNVATNSINSGVKSGVY